MWEILWTLWDILGYSSAGKVPRSLLNIFWSEICCEYCEIYWEYWEYCEISHFSVWNLLNFVRNIVNIVRYIGLLICWESASVVAHYFSVLNLVNSVRYVVNIVNIVKIVRYIISTSDIFWILWDILWILWDIFGYYLLGKCFRRCSTFFCLKSCESSLCSWKMLNCSLTLQKC